MLRKALSLFKRRKNTLEPVEMYSDLYEEIYA